MASIEKDMSVVTHVSRAIFSEILYGRKENSQFAYYS